MKCACAVLHCHLCPVRLYHIFLHYLLNSTIFREKYYVFSFSIKICAIFLIIRRIKRDFTVDVLMSLCKVPINRVRF